MVSFLSFVDDMLGTGFDAPKDENGPRRKRLIAIIDKAKEQRNDGKTPPTRAWKTGHNSAISFAPKLNGNPVLIGGKATNYIAADKFDAAMDALKKDVEAGLLDAEIKAALEGGAPAGGVAKRTRAPASGLGNKAQPDNAEWMAKFVEKYGAAPSADYVPNSKGTKWVSAKNAERGKKAKGVS
jgi:hypothetical protein